MASVAPVSAANSEEAHFQEVYRDFVTTREKCGEAAWESSPGMTISTVGRVLVDAPTSVLAVMSWSSNGARTPE